MPDDKDAIWVKKETKERFLKYGTVGMTQDEVLNSLMSFWDTYKDAVDRH